MIATCVNVWVKKDSVEDFIKESIKNHKESIKEPGNLKFDILQNSDDPTRFTLYEVYKTEVDSLDHKKTSHYNSWREAVADMMDKPREGVKHHVIAPNEVALWK